MNGKSTNWVIRSNPVNTHHRKYHDHTGNKTDNERTFDAHKCTRRSDGNEPSQTTVQGHPKIRLLQQKPRRKCCCKSARCGCRISRHTNPRDICRCSSHCGTRVKSEPSKPEDKTTDRRQSQIMSRNRINPPIGTVLTKSRSKRKRSEEHTS